MSGQADYDPRIVDLYDGDNPDGPDHDFYRSLARELQAQKILDLGCGTGMLTVTLAAPGRRTVGIDPSPAMLAFARKRAGSQRVEWIDGNSSSIPHESFDLVLMTGNVVQHIPDSDWPRTLQDIRLRMQVGGTLAFESRNPAARAWENWQSGDRTSRETIHGALVEWMDVEAADDRTVNFAAHNLFVHTGDTVTVRETLIFRSHEEITRDLQEAGFGIEAVYGSWTRTTFDGAAPVMIFVARAR